MNKFSSSIMRTAILLCASGLAVGAARAQDQSAPPPPPDRPHGQWQGPPPDGRRRGGPMDDRHHLEHLKKDLGLSDQQITQAKAVFEGERSQMEALHNDTSTPPPDKRDKMFSIRKDTESKFVALLTPEQKSKYEEQEAKRREHMQDRRHGPPPDGSAPPPPPPPAE